jgi:hypothetical protein
MDKVNFEADLLALANKYQVHISGKATPINPEEDDFDITAQATPQTTPVDTSPVDTTPVDTTAPTDSQAV